MLPREERLTKSSEFAFVYRQKKSVANSLLILYAGNKKTDKTLPARAGFVTSKKIHKKAVKRNRIKRLLRESYKNIKNTDDFLLKDYENLIFIARPNIIELDYYQIYDAVKDCFKKAYKKFG